MSCAKQTRLGEKIGWDREKQKPIKITPSLPETPLSPRLNFISSPSAIHPERLRGKKNGGLPVPHNGPCLLPLPPHTFPSPTVAISGEPPPPPLLLGLTGLPHFLPPSHYFPPHTAVGVKWGGTCCRWCAEESKHFQKPTCKFSFFSPKADQLSSNDTTWAEGGWFAVPRPDVSNLQEQRGPSLFLTLFYFRFSLFYCQSMESCGPSTPCTSRNWTGAEQSPDTFSPLCRASFRRGLTHAEGLMLNATHSAAMYRSGNVPSSVTRAIGIASAQTTLTCQNVVYFCSCPAVFPRHGHALTPRISCR